MSRTKKFILRYYLGCMILHEWGERTWPWNVRTVWELTDFDEKQVSNPTKPVRQD